MNRKWIAATLAAAFLAGCSGASNGTTDSTTISTDTSTTTQTSGPIGGPAQVPRNMTWNECHGIGMTVDYEYTTNPNPGRPPAGWQEQKGGVATNVFLDGFHCERVSWGSFERPISAILESHGNLEPPETCLGTGYSSRSALQSIWVDDAEFGKFLEQQYGMPVHVGEVRVEKVGDAATTSIVARWNETGSQPSSMQSIQVNEPTGTRPPYVVRFYWDAWNGTGMWDFKTVDTFSAAQVYAIQADMNPPMLNSQSKVPVLFATGEIRPSVEASGEITLFGDKECKVPLTA